MDFFSQPNCAHNRLNICKGHTRCAKIHRAFTIPALGKAMWNYQRFVICVAMASLSGPYVHANDIPVPSLKPAYEQSSSAALARFTKWKHDFMGRAAAKGYPPRLVEATVGRAILQERALESNKNQAEFVKPIWDYVKTAASDTRVKNGQVKLRAHNKTLVEIERRYGVDRHILTAIWGMESAYGKVLGNYNPVDVLSSFAFEGRRTSFGETQLFALLDLLKAGHIKVDQLKGSWAGAMGMTQFIPATFRDYAVDFNGDGNKDLWANEGDALGSAAHYLSRRGWVSEEPVFAEVSLPQGFDYTLADGQMRTLSSWTALGVNPFHGGSFTPQAGGLNAKLYLPAGANGPILLTFKNFDVIKAYNNSNSYAMGIATLARNLSGIVGISANWPERDVQISRSQKMILQRALTAQGFNTGGVDGAIGPMSQTAIRAWQKANNRRADGYVELALYKIIVRKAGMTP